jgi:pimeloyl-ACP methyl ester carboxylesterase
MLVGQVHLQHAPREFGDPFYDTLCAGSGTAYRQMVLWFLDPTGQARVDYDAVEAPVLVVAGAEDECTVPRLSRVIASKYGERATHVEISNSDHMMVAGPALRRTLAAIDEWLANHRLGGGVAREARKATPAG